MDELSDEAASRRLWAAVIRRCIDDCQSALTNDWAPGGDGYNQKLSARARQLMFAESAWWLLGPSEGDVSLDRCCAVLGLDGDAIRKKVWEGITEAHEIALRRRKLLPDQRAEILAGLGKARLVEAQPNVVFVALRAAR